MRRSTTSAVVLPLALGIAAALVPFALLRAYGHRHVMPGMYVHFIGVGVSALVASVASLALTIQGARRGDGRTVIIGTAFSVMAALLAIHGLATPGVLVGMNGVISFTGGATLPVGAALLALSALPSLRRPKSVRPLLVLQVVLLVGVIGLGVLGMLYPSIVPAVPETGSREAVSALLIGFALFLLLAARALKT